MTQVELRRENGVGFIEIDSPPVNALGVAVRAGILECLEQALADPSLHAIVLTGTGRHFSAGADIREFDAPPAAPHLPDVVHALEVSEKPVIAAINGTALGGGLEIAMGCHYRVAASTAKLGLPEVQLGLLPGAAGTQRLPRLVGTSIALDLMLSGRPTAADKARECGLVDATSEPDELWQTAASFAEKHAGVPVSRLRDLSVEDPGDAAFDRRRQSIESRSRGLKAPEMIIRCVEASTRMRYEDGCRFERDAFLACKASPQSAGLRHAFFAEREAAKVPGLTGSRETSGPRPIERIGIIGAGTMGAGIAYASLLAGFDVRLVDNQNDGLRRGRKTIEGYFEHAIRRGKLSDAAAGEGLTRLAASTDYDILADTELVIEAVFESMAVKQDVFRRLNERCKPGAILATNTSTLDIDQIAAVIGRPEDVVGLHFFSPAHIMRLLAIVRGQATANDVVLTCLSLARSLGKISVVVGNCFGFVGNRMLYSYGRENQMMLLEGAAPETIDRALEDWGMAMGPNAVGDLAGLDVGYKIRRERMDLPDDPRYYRVADMLAEQGRFGQKTGRGIYLYEEGSRTPRPDPELASMIRSEANRLGVDQREISNDEIVERCIFGLITEGAQILAEGIVQRASDIDVIWTNGYGFPRHRGGPMFYADQLGMKEVLARVEELADRFGSDYWRPPELLRELARTDRRFADVRP